MIYRWQNSLQKTFSKVVNFDLHMHSTFSDGALTPAELVNLAEKSGLQAMSLTDHDTVEGQPQAFGAARQKNIDIISGIELSASIASRPVHILGYGLDYNDAPLLAELKKIQQARKTRNSKIIRKLQDIGIDIEEENLRRYSQSGQTGRPHFAHLLIDRHLVKNNQEAFDRYLGPNGLAYTPRQILEAEKAIGIIRQARGAPVLAHTFTLGVLPDDLKQLVRELTDYGLAGIEVYYPQHSQQFQDELKKICAEFNLLETAGSDFHDIKRSGTRLGFRHHSKNVPPEIIEKLKEYLTGL